MGNSYITNPSAQQGEPEHRKGAVRPADIPANSEPPITDDDLLDEGPTEIPGHMGAAGVKRVKGGTDEQTEATEDTAIITPRKTPRQ